MPKDYYVKSISIKKDSNGKPFSYSVYYYHEKNPNFIYSETWSSEDFKKLYGDLDLNSLVGQRIGVKKELILK